MQKGFNKHRHLSANERDKITIFHAQGLSLRNIAKQISRSPSTISRELNRKEAVFFRGKYIGSQTHKKVAKLWSERHLRKKIDDNTLRKYIEQSLKLGFSPQLIAGRLMVKYNIKIHHETIYRYIYKDRTDLAQYLLRRKFGRKPKFIARRVRAMKPRIPNRVDIDYRDEIANLRLEFGHFECDSVVSSRKGKSCLTVMVDRATRKTVIRKTASKTARETARSIVSSIKKYSEKERKSLTYDNGCEFTRHQEINRKLGTKSYFSKPYHSWEKGTVENINGLIRRFFPKGTNFDRIEPRQLKYVEDWINNRPMKVLKFKTPNERYKELTNVS